QVRVLPDHQRFQLLSARSRPHPGSDLLNPPSGPRKNDSISPFDGSQSWNYIALVLAFLGHLIARAEFTAATRMRFNGNTCEKNSLQRAAVPETRFMPLPQAMLVA